MKLKNRYIYFIKLYLNHKTYKIKKHEIQNIIAKLQNMQAGEWGAKYEHW